MEELSINLPSIRSALYVNLQLDFIDICKHDKSISIAIFGDLVEVRVQGAT